MDTLKKDKEELKEIIINQGYFREKIILSSGKESDYYIDARRVTLSPQGAYLTAKIMLEMAKDWKIDAIGGPTLGADPIVGAISVLSLQAKRPLNTFIIRKAAKSHGRQKQIEGPDLKPGANVVIIDDVATTGKAFLESITALADIGIKADKALCIVDRNDGAQAALKEKGCSLYSIFNISEIHKP
ncbi:MAG: orotate phosphoribosyltransferase [Candidatus Omnitrophica bacterium]|nr:orotate phosphoribosyltransferase [Candidatus Omnitrophota bacterium]